MTNKHWILLIALGVIWGLSFIFNKILLPNWSIWTIVFMRCFFGFIFLYSVLLITKTKFNIKNHWKHGIIMALTNNVLPFAFIALGQKSIGAGLASIINSTTPITTLVVMLLFTNEEKLTINKVSGMVLAFMGVITLIGWEILFGNIKSAIGMLEVFGAPCCYALSGIYMRLNLKHIPAKSIAATQLFCSTLILLGLVLIFDDISTFQSLSSDILSRDFLIFLIYGGVSTGVAYLIFFKILSEAGAVNAALVTMLVPVCAILLAIIFLKEKFEPNHISGMVIIFTGLLIYDGKILKLITKSLKNNG